MEIMFAIGIAIFALFVLMGQFLPLPIAIGVFAGVVWLSRRVCRQG
jgi:hypothetical protein